MVPGVRTATPTFLSHCRLPAASTAWMDPAFDAKRLDDFYEERA